MLQKSIMALTVGAAFMAQAGETPSTGGSNITTMQGKALSGAVLKAFFEGSDAKAAAQKIAQTEGSRLKYLFAMFPQSSVEAVKTAVKEYREMAKKEYGEKSPQENTARNRAMEVQALYGAFRWADFKPDNIGYHSAVTESRNILKSRNIKWDGSKIPEKWEKDVRRQVEQDAQVELAARMERARRERAGEELTEEQYKDITEQARQQQERAGMVTLAGGLVRKYGPDKAEWLIEALEGAIASARAAAQEKAQVAKAA